MLNWLEQVKQQSVTFIETDKVVLQIPLKDRQRLKYKNYIEAAVISMLVDNFVHCGVQKSQFTVITPFREQLLLL